MIFPTIPGGKAAIISILREATSRWLGKQLVRTSQLVKAEAGVKTTRNHLLGSLGIEAEAQRCRLGDRLTREGSGGGGRRKLVRPRARAPGLVMGCSDCLSYCI